MTVFDGVVRVSGVGIRAAVFGVRGLLSKLSRTREASLLLDFPGSLFFNLKYQASRGK